ncbi:hypothetical protein M8C21_029008 [Ambrosia artemisiifolia]|uniref:Uncharacterized protein n=1 Tax=Ambrosia artemisiifolia TaxID=4212 RepID=A0AAD5GL09_AMBAR|nr:hypothetical protein M8C21_029008 [Ambrosia artemisiifolia]
MVNGGEHGNEEEELVAVLTSPLSLDGESRSEYTSPNLMQRIFSLFKNVRPGSDLTRFSLPAIFNIPKSQLQCYGESVYCVNDDIISICANGGTPLERFTSVIAWSISMYRPFMFGVAPYNPILGETHYASRGNLNVLLEQVSHHPPVSALHATNEKDNIEMIWCQYAIPKFQGTSIETRVLGKRELRLLNKGESYVMNSPNLVIKFLPMPDVEWLGDVTIQCRETGLEAHLTVTIEDISNGKSTVIYTAKDVISSLKTPIVKDPKELWASESAVIWAKVNENILSKSWDKANDAKRVIEEKERELARSRMLKGETWVPKHFVLSSYKVNGELVWEVEPKNIKLTAAPIVVPL